MRTTSLSVLLLIGCTAVRPTPRYVFIPDPPAREHEAAQDACPQNGFIEFHKHTEDGDSLTLELHCGGYLDDCDRYTQHIRGWLSPDSPHIVTAEGWPSSDEEEESFSMDITSVGPASAMAVWRVASESHWQTWESCSGEATGSTWTVEIDDGDEELVSVSCDGHLPSEWHATFDSLDSLQPTGRSYRSWRDDLEDRE
jgi:hypothetical protein